MDASYIFLYISSRHYSSVFFFFFLKFIKKSFFEKTNGVSAILFQLRCVSDRGYTLYEPIRKSICLRRIFFVLFMKGAVWHSS